MSKKQLISLFACSLVTWTIGNGLLPLLPVYASNLGASSAVTGYYLAFAYLALTLGTMLAGWLSDRFQRRKILLIAVGIPMILSIWMTGRASNIWHLTVLTAVVWALGGMQIALVNILTGLFADKEKRGAVFGFIGLTPALGLLVGGLTSGFIGDRWGYPAMFMVFAIFSAIGPIAAMLLEDKTVVRNSQEEITAEKKKTRIGSALVLLVIAVVFAQTAAYTGNIGRSISMKELGFSSTAISSTAAVSGAVSLPFPLLIGWLSDKLGRKQLILFCYLAGAVGLLVLAYSVSLWHFWIYASLGAIGAVSQSVGAAFATDLVPQESLGVGMSLVRSGYWVGGILGFAVAGYSIQTLGIMTTSFISAALCGIAIVFLLLITKARIKSNGMNTVISP